MGGSVVVDLICELPKDDKYVASESPKNRRFRLPHCHLTSPLQGTSVNIRVNLILPESRVIKNLRYILPLIVWVYLHSNFRGGLRKRVYFEKECEMAVQGHTKSLISVHIESAYATSY